MDGLLWFFLIFLFLLLIFSLASSLTTIARRKYTENQAAYARYHDRFLDARRRVQRIQTQIFWHWPIWPRPILFDAVDRSTQLALGSAEHAMRQVDALDLALEHPPALAYDITAMLNIKQRLDTIMACNRNAERFAAFRAYYETIILADRAIRQNQQEVDAILERLKRDLRDLPGLLSQVSNHLAFFQRLGAVRFDDARRNVETAKACIDQAHAQVAQHNDNDRVGWAAASLLFEAVRSSIRVFQLKQQAYAFSENYEPDAALERLAELTNDLSLLENVQVWDQWKQLVSVRNHLLPVEDRAGEAEELLRDFDEKRQVFLQQLEALKRINTGALTQHAAATEARLSSYIGAPADAPDTWRRLLGSTVTVEEQLEAQKQTFENTIRPLIHGNVIRQTQLPEITHHLDRFLAAIQGIQQSLKRVEILCNHHERSEQEVLARLGPEGRARQAVATLAGFAGNAAPEIMEASQQRIEEFNTLLARAHGPRPQAGFPDLLTRLGQLETACAALASRHQAEITQLQRQAAHRFERLKATEAELLQWRDAPPQVDLSPWPDFFAYFGVLEQAYAGAGGDYRLLHGFLENARRFSADAERVLAQLRGQHETFQTQYSQLRKKLEAMTGTVDQYIALLAESWPAPLAYDIELLQQFRQEYQTLRAELEAKATEQQMNEAAQGLRYLQQQLRQTDRFTAEVWNRANGWMRHLNNRMDEINALLNDRTRATRNPAAAEFARGFIDNARAASSPEAASQLLQFARQQLSDGQPMPMPRARTNVSPTTRPIGVTGKRPAPQHQPHDRSGNERQQ